MVELEVEIANNALMIEMEGSLRRLDMSVKSMCERPSPMCLGSARQEEEYVHGVVTSSRTAGLIWHAWCSSSIESL